MIDQIQNEAATIKRHVEVLERVIDDEPIGMVKLSNESGYDHHKVHYSLRMLEEDGLVEPTKQGAVTTEQTAEFVSNLDDNVATLTDRLEQLQIDDLDVTTE